MSAREITLKVFTRGAWLDLKLSDGDVVVIEFDGPDDTRPIRREFYRARTRDGQGVTHISEQDGIAWFQSQ